MASEIQSFIAASALLATVFFQKTERILLSECTSWQASGL
jgi:hypothetical protein